MNSVLDLYLLQRVRQPEDSLPFSGVGALIEKIMYADTTKGYFYPMILKGLVPLAHSKDELPILNRLLEEISSKAKESIHNVLKNNLIHQIAILDESKTYQEVLDMFQKVHGDQIFKEYEQELQKIS